MLLYGTYAEQNLHLEVLVDKDDVRESSIWSMSKMVCLVT